MRRNAALNQQNDLWFRISLALLALAILILVYIFQRAGFLALMGWEATGIHPNLVFIVNRSIRLIVNDFACFLLIYVFFREKKYLRMAFWVFLLELLVILPLYLTVKLTLEGDSEISSPLLSQIHRLIVNPTLMILLMAGFFYQKFSEKMPTKK